MLRAGLAAVLALLPWSLPAQPGATAPPPADACAAEGEVQFLCFDSPIEDLVALPGTDWIAASAYSGTGGVRLVNGKDRGARLAYPGEAAREAPDRRAFPDCPGPVSASDKARFSAHGLALETRHGRARRLYVIHHGDRESVEVFDVAISARVPALTWVGCVPVPDPLELNSLVLLPDGGFVATQFGERGAGRDASRADRAAGRPNGSLWRWQPAIGWRKLAGSEGSGLNGIERSRDGRWLYVAEWGAKRFVRMAFADPARRDVLPLGFRLDNLRWAPDGTLLGAGQTEHGSKVVRIDPRAMTASTVFEQAGTTTFSESSSALRVGGELWIAAPRYTRVAIVPAPR